MSCPTYPHLRCTSHITCTCVGCRVCACSGEVITRAHGDVRDNIGHPSTNGQMVAIDPDGRVIAMHLYDGLIKVWTGVWTGVWAGVWRIAQWRLHDAFTAYVMEHPFNTSIML